MTTPAELRNWIVQLSDNAERDLALLWSQLDARTVRDGLFDVMPALVGDYGDAAATVSAEWYDEHRASLNVAGGYAADVPANPDLGAEALAGWGSQLATENWDSALALISGGLVKRIFTASRETLTTATVDDPQARGWQRSGVGACPFCRMLIGRGAVFTRATVNFGAHDNCRCVAVPAFGGRPAPVKPYEVSTRDISDADRARANAWIAANL
ncbi:head maturation protease [Gordonia phage Lucky10]|uniref:Capsid maturation protease n=1 Tax=Gordonia phage Lucky10 TaxID=1821557 RepID=A0A142KAW4_9CAUD|nr:head maturation protease [Gordonia phage Lucky10]AMS03247.1 capsid maturation protease [Gordonia phage Lucky10]